MKTIECVGCGGTLKESGKYLICENCGTRYALGKDDEGNPFTYQPIEKKTIEFGAFENKASHIEVNTLSVKRIKLDDSVDIAVHKEGMNLEKQERIHLANTFLKSKEWDAAQEQVNALLVEDHQCAEAKWFGMMLDHKATSDVDLVKKLSSVSENDKTKIDDVLANSSPRFARQISDAIFSHAFYNDNMLYSLYSVTMPYAYNTSVYSESEIARIKQKALDISVAKMYERSFDYLLTITLNPDEVDRYIYYLNSFASKCAPVSAQKYYSKILKVDPANMDANHKLMMADVQANSPCEKAVRDFEHLLKYSNNTDGEVSSLLSYMVSEQTTTPEKSDFVWQLMGYHSKAPEVFKNELLKYAKLLLKTDQWNNAQKYFQLILSFDPRNADAYWGLCMVKMQVRSESAIAMKKDNLIDSHEFKKALSLYQSAGNVQRSNELMQLTKKQRIRKKITKIAIIVGAGILALIVFIVVVSSIASRAEGNSSRASNSIGKKRVYDEAGLLTDKQNQELERHIKQISRELKFDIIIVTVNTTNGKYAENFSNDYYDSHGLGYGDTHDGILLLLIMDAREFYVCTYGEKPGSLSNYTFSILTNEAVSSLSAGDYYTGFTVFVDKCKSVYGTDY